MNNKEIKQRIESSGLKKKFFCEKLDIKPSTFSQYLSGERTPPEDKQKEIIALVKQLTV